MQHKKVKVEAAWKEFFCNGCKKELSKADRPFHLFCPYCGSKIDTIEHIITAEQNNDTIS